MSAPRIYYPDALASGRRIELPEQAAHHAARVLRLKSGDPVTLFNGQGGEFEASIEHIGKHSVAVLTGARRDPERESPLAVTLAQAISAGEKMDYTLQKAVELGIGHIQPLFSERSVIRLSGERADKRVQHWQNVVIAACEQCGRNLVPPVAPIMPLETWLGNPRGEGMQLMLAPGAAETLRTLPRPQGAITLLIGPEGGFSPNEAKAAEICGFQGVRLGPRTLRTETAALAALAAMQALWGDF
jgi:16S rRNA (uracil1498-N3)-methyltransferase